SLHATTGGLSSPHIYRVTAIGALTANGTPPGTASSAVKFATTDWISAGSALGAMLKCVTGSITVDLGGGVTRQYDVGGSGGLLPESGGFGIEDRYGLPSSGFGNNDHFLAVTVEEGTPSAPLGGGNTSPPPAETTDEKISATFESVYNSIQVQLY